MHASTAHAHLPHALVEATPQAPTTGSVSRCHAYYGFELQGIVPGDGSERLSRQAMLLARLCGSTATLGEERAIELRYLVVPRTAENGWKGAVRCVLLARVSVWLSPASEQMDSNRVDAYQRDIANLIATTLPSYAFAPLAQATEIEAILRPFECKDVVEFTHPIRHAPGLTPDEPPIQLALPLMGAPDADSIIELLLRQAYTTVVSICFGPENQELVQTAIESHVLQPPTLDMLASGVAHGPGPFVPSPEPTPAITTSSMSQWQRHHLSALLQRALRMRLHLASPGPLSSGVITALAAEFGGPGTFTAEAAWRDATLPVAGSATWRRPRTARRNATVPSPFAHAVLQLESVGLDELGAAQAVTLPDDIANGNHSMMLTLRTRQPDPLAALNTLADLGEATRIFALPARAPWLPNQRAALALPYASDATSGVLLGNNRVNGIARPVWLPDESRRHHLWIIGQTGTGKTTLLESQILQDVRAGRGVIVLDPHGDLIRQIAGKIPKRRHQDVILFDPADTEFPIGINPLDATSDDEKMLVVSSFIGFLRKHYDPHNQGIVGPRFEHGARNGLLSAMSLPEGGTLIEVVRIFQNKAFARYVRQFITDPMVQTYWDDQITNTNDFHQSEVLDWIVSKFGHFATDLLLRRLIGQSKSSFSFRRAMDEGKIVLVSLAKGRVGFENANFLGLILLPKILHAALSRADLPERQRRPVSIYVDEFQNYVTDSLAQMLAEVRKYNVALTLANQHVGQLTGEVRDAVIGNVGSVLAFRLGLADAMALAQILEPSPLTAEHLVGLPNHTAYGRALIGGQHTPVFTLHTERPTERFDEKRLFALRDYTRATYAKTKAQVDAEINARARMDIVSPKG